MGTSFTSYRGKGFWARDGQVEVWLYLLVQEIDRLDPPPDWLLEVRHDWHVNATLGMRAALLVSSSQRTASSITNVTAIPNSQNRLAGCPTSQSSDSQACVIFSSQAARL